MFLETKSGNVSLLLKNRLEMERGILRMLVVVVVIFLVVGDWTTLFSSTLHMMGLAPPTKQGKPSGKSSPKTKIDLDDDDDLEDEDAQTLNILGSSPIAKSTLMATIRNSCLPKLICELNATPHRERLTDSEKSLLGLIRDTSISTTAEVTSKYHFAAHMGQLIAGIEGTGCHNFYPGCPFPGLQVLQMMKKVKIR